MSCLEILFFNMPYLLFDMFKGPLSGLGSIDIHDKVWTNLNFGKFLDNFDLVNAEICIKLDMDFVVNILKVCI